MLKSTNNDGQSWTVFWLDGGSSVMCTGKDNKFELQHLRVGVMVYLAKQASSRTARCQDKGPSRRTQSIVYPECSS
jgi:hypothetical protein